MTTGLLRMLGGQASWGSTILDANGGDEHEGVIDGSGLIPHFFFSVYTTDGYACAGIRMGGAGEVDAAYICVMYSQCWELVASLAMSDVFSVASISYLPLRTVYEFRRES